MTVILRKAPEPAWTKTENGPLRHGPPTEEQWLDWCQTWANWRYLRFALHLRARDWIPFAEVAEWYALEEGTGRRDDGRQKEAYGRLLRGLKQGKFNRDGRCTVYFLWFNKSEYETHRFGADLLNAIASYPGDGAAVHLESCWAPSDLLLKWCDSIKLRRHPDWPKPSTPIEATKRVLPAQQDEAKESEIVLAFLACFPDGKLHGVQKQRRDDRIKSHFLNKGGTPPSDRTIRRRLREWEMAKNGQ